MTFKSKFKDYFLSKIFFNFLSWIFIGLTFFMVAIASDVMGLGPVTRKPIEGISTFNSPVLIISTVAGLAVMAMFLQLLRGLFANARAIFGIRVRKEVVSDDDAAEMVRSEILSQLNSLANLSFAICLYHWLDVAMRTKSMVVLSVFDPMTLIETSCALYAVAFIVFFASSGMGSGASFPPAPHEGSSPVEGGQDIPQEQL